MCPIPNGFRVRTISSYSCKIVYKEILRTISNIGINWPSDKFGKVYLLPYVFENSTFNINVFIPRVRTWRVARQSSSLRHFMQAITSSMLTSISSRVSTFLLYTPFFIQPHRQTSNGVRSGDLGDQLKVLPRPIHLLGKVPMRCCITSRV